MRATFLTILKVLCFVLLIPPVITTTMSFIGQLHSLPEGYQRFFVWGLVSYLVMHLFILEPRPVYDFGQRLVAGAFRFLAPLAAAVPLAVPVYSVFFIIILYFKFLLWPSTELGHCLIFFAGFMLSLHVIFNSKVLREGDKNGVKPDYFFPASLAYLANLVIIALLLGLVFSEFSIPGFFAQALDMARGIYVSVFKQLFVPGS